VRSLVDGKILSFSIVTPSLNQGRFILATIQSVLGQDYPAIEYRIVDGGSRDQTVEILRSHGQKFHWISEPDEGQADAINKGFRQSTGDVLGWLNADDLYCKEALSLVAREFQADPDLMMVYGDAYHINSEGKLLDKYPNNDFRLESLVSGCFICQPACLFRRKLFDTVGGLDIHLHYALDLDLWIRFGIAQKSNPSWRFTYLPRVLAYSRMHRQNKTLYHREESLREIGSVVKKHFGIVPFNWVYALEEAKTGAYDGYYTKSPLSPLLLFRSLFKWIWTNRRRPSYLVTFIKDSVCSPRQSAKRLVRRTETRGWSACKED
jgi:glycosyltransferase involved in cell wall biosynthesis